MERVKLEELKQMLRSYLADEDDFEDEEGLFDVVRSESAWRSVWEDFEMFKVLKEEDDIYVRVLRGVDYRLAFMVMIRERIGSVIADLLKVDYRVAWLGVPIRVMNERLGDQLMRVFLIKLMGSLVGDRMKAMEMVMVVSRLMVDLRMVSLEELIRAVTYGNTGKYGDVYNEVKSKDVVGWVKAYVRERNDFNRKLSEGKV